MVILTVGGLISFKMAPKKGKRKRERLPPDEFRMRCDYLDVTQRIGELWRLISEQSHVFCGKKG